MADQEKEAYLKQLEEKVEHLKTEFDRIPFAQIFQNKMWRYTSDIEQLSWRINYLKKSQLK